MSTFNNWTDFHQRLNLIFHAIVAITMLPFVWLYLEIDTDRRAALLTDSVVMALFVIICLSLIGTSHFFKKKRLPEATQKTTLREKLDAYLQIQMVNYALLEAAALFATIAFYLTASYVFVIVYLFVLFVFSLNRPNLERVCRELLLKKAERDLLADRKPITD